MSKLFSILVVCLNPGSKLVTTLDSIKSQSFDDYEVIVKDGGSSDGSVDIAESYIGMNVKVISERDSGIYDAMNHALDYATGKYVYFLNCGDGFADENVLKVVAEAIEKNKPKVVYGNIYEQKTGTKVCQNPVIDGFACYRNVPCHQACFYLRELVKVHPFDLSYKVRADYEQFLWCYFEGNADFKYVDYVIASYEGDGYSESKDGLKISSEEHQRITKKYMTEKEIRSYKRKLILSLAPLRTALAHNPATAKIYNGIKNSIYGKRK